MKKVVFGVLIIFVVIAAGAVYFYLVARGDTGSRSMKVAAYLRSPEKYPHWEIRAGETCADAPFQMPTNGFIGFVWDDSFRPGHHHQGLDIFGGTKPGVTSVYAAYDGYLSRLPDWKSTVIVRIPSDPFNPGQQIWTYYTHMADKDGNSSISAEFPPGTIEVFVPAGTLLGYQGNFSGSPGNPTGVHLHFSIVKDDGNGKFMNELEIKNTLDPSPYLGLNVNANQNPHEIPVCEK